MGGEIPLTKTPPVLAGGPPIYVTGAGREQSEPGTCRTLPLSVREEVRREIAAALWCETRDDGGSDGEESKVRPGEERRGL